MDKEEVRWPDMTLRQLDEWAQRIIVARNDPRTRVVRKRGLMYFEAPDGFRFTRSELETVQSAAEGHGNSTEKAPPVQEKEPKQQTERQRDLDRLRFLTKTLFDMDPKEALRVDHLMSMPVVRSYLERWNVQESTLRRTLNLEAPEYAKRNRGRPKNAGRWEEEETGEYWLRLPYRE